MPFQRGRSGNPSGRPPKNRALTDVLEAAGKKPAGKSKQPRNEYLAEKLWQIVVEGETRLENGKVLDVSPSDWLGVVQFIYKQIDGPPKGEMEIGLDDPTLDVIRIIVHGE